MKGRAAVAIDRLTVDYSLCTMISDGVIFDSMTLDNPTILLQRDHTGWNFNRFVKTRQNTGGRGAPPITMESIAINNGHLIVNDRGRLVEDLHAACNTQFRFAYEKPGHRDPIGQMSADAGEMAVRRLAGDLRFDRGSIRARDLAIETDRSKLVTAITYSGPQEKLLDITLDAERLSLPEIGRYFKPLATITLEPAVDHHRERHARRAQHGRERRVVRRHGARTARGAVRQGSKSLGGRLDVSDVDMAPILNRVEWKTRVTGQADFTGPSTPPRSISNLRARMLKVSVPGRQRARTRASMKSAARRRTPRTGGAAVRCERRLLWRQRYDARDIPFRHAVATVVVSARRHIPQSRYAAVAESPRCPSSTPRLRARTRST